MRKEARRRRCDPPLEIAPRNGNQKISFCPFLALFSLPDAIHNKKMEPQCSTFDELPIETIHHIFSFLSARHLAQVCTLVERSWAEAINDVSLWRVLATRDFQLRVNPHASLASHSRQLAWYSTSFITAVFAFLNAGFEDPIFTANDVISSFNLVWPSRC